MDKHNDNNDNNDNSNNNTTKANKRLNAKTVGWLITLSSQLSVF